MNNEPASPRVILATCCLSLFLVTMDVTIVNVALPAIRHDLHSSVSGLQWSIDGYTVVIASFLLLAGAMGDRVGRRRTFQAGLVLFSLGSLLCSLAPTTSMLVAFRMFQALGGAMLNPVAMAIIVNTFRDPKARARAIGVWGAVFGISMAVGPLLGGALTQHVGWRSIFWVNIPIGLVAIALTRRYVPESRSAQPRRSDAVGQLLVIVLLGTLTTAVIEGRRAGWGSPLIVALFSASVLALSALVLHERRREQPLIDMRFFQSIPFSAATLCAITSFSAFAAFLFLNSLYLQEVRGLPAERAGLYTLPIAGALVVFAPLSGRLVAAGRARTALVLAGMGIATGGLMLTTLEVGTSTSYLLAAYATFGVGMGLVNAPITNTAVSGMPRAQAGLAAAIASTSRQVGSGLGVALAGAIAGGGLVAAHGADFATSTHPMWWVIAVDGLVIVALGFASTGARAMASARRVAYLVDPPGLA